MSQYAPGSHDPANDDSLLGMLNVALRKFLQGVDNQLPARVISYDRDANRATVQPIIAMLTTTGQRVARAQIADVPVLRIGGGGHVLAFNLKPGDLGWIQASDRDISLFLQSYGEGAPNTRRFHSFEDGLFIPDAMKDVQIASEDADHVVLQTLDGTHRIAIWGDRVKVTSGESQFVVQPGVITVQALQINLNGNVTTGGGPGTPNVVMEASASLTLRAPSVVVDSPNIMLGGIRWQTHRHTGVQTGPDNTGGPIA